MTQDELVEIGARALVRSRGAELIASDDQVWADHVAHYRDMAERHGALYTDGNSLITSAFRDSAAFLSALSSKGLAVVPVEPTEAMLEIGQAKILEHSDVIIPMQGEIWSAMLRAAARPKEGA